jgi:hypothetical protein
MNGTDGGWSSGTGVPRASAYGVDLKACLALGVNLHHVLLKPDVALKEAKGLKVESEALLGSQPEFRVSG